MTFNELLESDHFATVAKCMPSFRALYTARAANSGLTQLRVELSGATLRSWQSALVDIIKGPVCPRKVYWCYDLAGNTGKSFMGKYLMAWHDATIFTHGKLSDMAFAYNLERVVVIDLARTQSDKLDHMYQFIENLKNGILFSPKYESGTKCFPPPHVIVFANFEPDRSKLSEDRWFIKALD